MATNAYLAQQAQIESLSVARPLDWVKLHAEVVEAETELAAFEAKLIQMEDEAEALTVAKLGPQPEDRVALMVWIAMRERLIAKHLPALDEDSRRYDGLLDFTRSLQRTLVEMPAPDRDALRWKISFLFPENDRKNWGDHPNQEMQVFVADVQRLLDGEL